MRYSGIPSINPVTQSRGFTTSVRLCSAVELFGLFTEWTAGSLSYLNEGVAIG